MYFSGIVPILSEVISVLAEKDIPGMVIRVPILMNACRIMEDVAAGIHAQTWKVALTVTISMNARMLLMGAITWLNVQILKAHTHVLVNQVIMVMDPTREILAVVIMEETVIPALVITMMTRQTII